MKKILKFIKSNLIWALILVMIAGLTVGQFFDVSGLKQFVLPLAFLMIYPMMIKLNFAELFK